MKTGIVFDIKHYAIHDGPGIRTTIFFKGCPLSCRWCHNPESIQPSPQLVYRPDRCIGCGECVPVCPKQAIFLDQGHIIKDPVKCIHCGQCASVCPADAREMAGKRFTVDEVLNIIEKDRLFYEQSNGGVTFSGGEPLMQHEFLIELLKRCKDMGIHRAVDTSGFRSFKVLSEAAEHTNLFLFDIKHLNTEKHRMYTGVFNEQIIENLLRLSKTGREIIIRFPLIPGFNDDFDHINQMGQFISKLSGIKKTDIIPFHASAKGKYKTFGRPYLMEELHPPEDAQIQAVAGILEQYGINTGIGG